MRRPAVPLLASLLLHAALLTAVSVTVGTHAAAPATFAWAVRPSEAEPAGAEIPQPAALPVADIAAEEVAATPLPDHAPAFAQGGDLDTAAPSSAELPSAPPLAAWHLTLRRPVATTPVVAIADDDTRAPAKVAAAPPAPPQPEVIAPLAGHNPAPEYPESARRRRIEGTVVVRFEIDGTGATTACRIAASSGSAVLDAAALAAAAQWRFERGPGRVEVPFTFRLAGGPGVGATENR